MGSDDEANDPAPDSDDDGRLALRLVQYVQTAGRNVLGSELGQIIRAEFPASTFKARYGSLRAFIDARCSKEIARVGRLGLNDEYADATALGVAGGRHGSSGPVRALPSPWQAFSNPNGPAFVAVHVTTGTLAVLLRTDATPADHVRVEPLSTAEYKDMARSFLEECTPDLKASLTPIIAVDDFWQPWRTAVNGAGPAVQSSWMRHRAAFAFDRWTERLRAASIEQHAIDVSLGLLRGSMRLRARRTSQAPSPGARPADAPNHLRSVIADVLASLSDADLERLWLPVGAVLAAARRNRP